MDGIIRRREFLEDKIWRPISGNAFTSWYKTSGVTSSNGSIVMKPTALNWNFILSANNLKFKWGSIKNGKLRIVFDITITNKSSTSGYVSFSYQTCNSANPNSQRYKYGEVVVRNEGTTHVSKIIYPIRLGSGSGESDDYYFGASIYAYTGNGSTVTISNLSYEAMF